MERGYKTENIESAMLGLTIGPEDCPRIIHRIKLYVRDTRICCWFQDLALHNLCIPVLQFLHIVSKASLIKNSFIDILLNIHIKIEKVWFTNIQKSRVYKYIIDSQYTKLKLRGEEHYVRNISSKHKFVLFIHSIICNLVLGNGKWNILHTFYFDTFINSWKLPWDFEHILKLRGTIWHSIGKLPKQLFYCHCMWKGNSKIIIGNR